MKGGRVGFLNLLFTFLAKFVGAVLVVSGAAAFILILCVPALVWEVDGVSYFKELRIKDLIKYLTFLFGMLGVVLVGIFIFFLPGH